MAFLLCTPWCFTRQIGQKQRQAPPKGERSSFCDAFGYFWLAEPGQRRVTFNGPLNRMGERLDVTSVISGEVSLCCGR